MKDICGECKLPFIRTHNNQKYYKDCSKKRGLASNYRSNHRSKEVESRIKEQTRVRKSKRNLKDVDSLYVEPMIDHLKHIEENLLERRRLDEANPYINDEIDIDKL